MSWATKTRRWRAKIHWTDNDGKVHDKHVGLYVDETEAAKAFDEAARRLLPAVLLERFRFNFPN